MSAENDHCMAAGIWRGPSCRNKVRVWAPKRNGGHWALCVKHADAWQEKLLDSMPDFVWALRRQAGYPDV